ncbi:hypothetical protein MGLY_08740 [Neomoorella glycerini]|uniref:PTS EIIA type-4 domain-containing protein n=1 Tax=Neomoorella glycerini TaxID=55779 RepID=A0A6I5ZP16_9FIRM|nr:hypothetical protein [Moorella glycerini]QGP91538.1 hypothetical protein MGLY_08740 [Moorella glycerini]
MDQGDGVLLLVDVAGGSPANIALEMVTAGNRAVVTGVNLPMLQELAPGGGYILAPSNHIGPHVAPESIVAMYRAAAELGRY